MLTFQHLLWESHEEKKTIYHHICVHFHKHFHNMHRKRNTLLQPKNAHGGGQCGGIISLKPVDGGLNNLKKWNHANVRPRVRPTPWLVLLWRWYTILGHTKHSMNLWLTSIYLKRKLSLERIQAPGPTPWFSPPVDKLPKRTLFSRLWDDFIAAYILVDSFKNKAAEEPRGGRRDSQPAELAAAWVSRHCCT